MRRAIHKKTGQYRAVKIIRKDRASEDTLNRIKIEVEILKKMDHPNILKIYEFYNETRYFYIVSELCTGGELFDKLVEEK